MDLIFEEPTPKLTRHTDPYETELAEAVREHPGQWVRMEKDFSSANAATVASNIRAGKRKAFGDGFTAESRTLEGKGVVYVRYGQSAD